MAKNRLLKVLSLSLRFLMAAILFILLGLLVDLVNFSLLPLADEEGLVQPFFYTPDVTPALSADSYFADYWLSFFEEASPADRHVVIGITPDQVSIEFNLTLDRKEPLAGEIANGIYGGTDAFVQAVFGQIQLDHENLDEEDYQQPTWAVDPITQKFTLTIRSVKPVEDSSLSLWLGPGADGRTIQPATDEVVVLLSGMVIETMEPLPDEANDETIKLTRSAPEMIEGISFSVRPTEVIETTAVTSQKIDRQSYMQRLSRLLDKIPVVSEFLFALSELLPLVIFMIVAAKISSRKASPATLLAALTATFLLFHFALYLINGATGFVYGWDLVDKWDEQLYNLSLPYFRPYILPLLGSGSWRMGVVALGVLLPTFFLQRVALQKPDKPGKKSWTLRWLLQRATPKDQRTLEEKKVVKRQMWGGLATLLNSILFGLLIASLFFAAAQIVALREMIWNSSPALQDFFSYYPLDFKSLFTPDSLVIQQVLTGAVPVWIWILLAASLCTLLVRFVIGLLYRLFTGRKTALAPWFATLLIVGGALYRPFLARGAMGRVGESAVWFIYTILLGAFLIFAYLYAADKGLRALGWKRQPIHLVWIILAVLLLAIPSHALFSADGILAYESEIFNLAYRLDDLIIFVWTAGAALALYRDGKADLKLSRATRTIGLLAAAALLFGMSSRWLYIPVTFLLGWLALRWLTSAPGLWGKLDEQFKQVEGKRAQLLDRINLLKVARGVYANFRKKWIEKMAGGESTPDELKAKLDAYEQGMQKIDSLPDADMDKSFIGQPLAFGPERTAWLNGLHGLKWAALFALPWLLIYLFDFMKGVSYSQSYPLLDFAVDLLTIFWRWAAIGFVLGYFFPYLRGNNGLQKGLNLALVIILPTLPLHFIFYRSAESWQAFLFWALQVFIECILLGLAAFDYATLRKEQRSFQALLEIHGLQALGLWAVSLVAAIGTSAVTLFSSQAITLISLILKSIIPGAPLDVAPK